MHIIEQLNTELNSVSKRATRRQVRQRYASLGYQVRINKDGYVAYRYPARDALWLNGRYVSEYRVLGNQVVLS